MCNGGEGHATKETMSSFDSGLAMIESLQGAAAYWIDSTRTQGYDIAKKFPPTLGHGLEAQRGD